MKRLQISLVRGWSSSVFAEIRCLISNRAIPESVLDSLFQQIRNFLKCQNLCTQRGPTRDGHRRRQDPKSFKNATMNESVPTNAGRGAEAVRLAWCFLYRTPKKNSKLGDHVIPHGDETYTFCENLHTETQTSRAGVGANSRRQTALTRISPNLQDCERKNPSFAKSDGPVSSNNHADILLLSPKPLTRRTGDCLTP